MHRRRFLPLYAAKVRTDGYAPQPPNRRFCRNCRSIFSLSATLSQSTSGEPCHPSDLPGSAVLLDLACGPGRVTLDLAASFEHVHAIDLEAEMIEVGRREAARRGV